MALWRMLVIYLIVFGGIICNYFIIYFNFIYMNLYLFPESAELNNGYGIAVNDAYHRLKPQCDDIVIWFTNSNNIPYLNKNSIIVRKPSFFNLKRIINVLMLRPSLEFPSYVIKQLRSYNFDLIHCDEVIFYKSIRKYFPNKHISVRFHNCFSRINDRRRILNISLDWKFRLNLFLFSHLEREIFRDFNVFKIFLTNEDNDYYKQMVGSFHDSTVWPSIFDKNLFSIKSDHVVLSNKIVWFGSLAAHKFKSLEWFIDFCWPLIHNEIPSSEFHLWGNGTELFDNNKMNIFAHGYYNGNSLFPLYNALYINPDIIGGGIKIKLFSYLTNNIPFVSTIFGFEGFDYSLVDNKYCSVVGTSDFALTIIHLLKKYE